uniref:Uncharacterized protein n=1 Tax=Chenopodium quinoa TaxID=63459 RepID=A0A803NBU2_CHEQI
FLGFCLALEVYGGMVALDGIGGYSCNFCPDGLTVYGNRLRRVRDVDMKRDYAFVEFSDPRDAEDARYSLNARDVDGSRIIVEFAKGGPRGPGGSRESRDFGSRGPAPGSGRCFNCGIEGHWARDCKAGDWKNKCYRCGERGHIERNCQNSPKKLSQSRSPPKRERDIERAGRSRSPRPSKSPVKSRSPIRSRSPKRQKSSPLSSRGRKRSPTPDDRSPEGRGRSSDRDERRANGSDYAGSPRSRSRTPVKEGERESPRNGDARSRSPFEENGRDHSASPVARNDKNGKEDDNDDYEASPRGSE